MYCIGVAVDDDYHVPALINALTILIGIDIVCVCPCTNHLLCIYNHMYANHWDDDYN